jgi:hypothetical protein
LLTPQIIDAQNHRAFSSPFAVKAYTAVDGLTPGEVTILETLRSRITDKAILDIGVGAGRTTPSLLEIKSRLHGH